MPISKNGKLFYTEQQHNIAASVGALDYALKHYDLKRTGSSYRMREHDSLVFDEKGMFFWNSRGIIGNAVKFIQVYEDRTNVEAVLILAGELDRNTGCLVGNYSPQIPQKRVKPEQTPVKDYKPPPRDATHTRVYAYLTKTRGIHGKLVSSLIKQRKVYQTFVTPAGKRIYNAVFILENANGKTGALLRGITDNNHFKSIHAGSDRERGYFHFCGSGAPDTVCVFESPIDAMSYNTLITAHHLDIENPGHYLARGGTGDKNIFQFLQEHPEVKKIISCDDNDKAGKLFAETLLIRLKAMGYETRRQAPELKDYNMVLAYYKKKFGHGWSEGSG